MRSTSRRPAAWTRLSTEARTAQRLDPLSMLINMTRRWALHFAGRPEEAIRETLRTRELAPGFQEAGNSCRSSTRELGRFEDAAQVAWSSRIYGVPADGGQRCSRRSAPAARRPTGASVSSYLDAALGHAPPSIHFGYAVLLHPARRDGPGDRPSRAAGGRPARATRCSSRVDPCLRSLHGEPRFERSAQAAGCRPWLQHRIQRRHDRHRHAGARRPADHRALQRFDLDPLPLRQIDQQRRTHRPRDAADVAADPVDRCRPRPVRLRRGPPLDLAAPVQELRPDLSDPPRAARSAGAPRR